MEKIIWDSKCSVGDAKIDYQHQQMVSMINELMEQIEAGTPSRVYMADLLAEMREHAENSFAAEEAKMLVCSYPDFEMHRKQHYEFKRKYCEFCIDTINNKESASQDILRYLVTWWTCHIQAEDQKCRPYFEAKAGVS